MGFQNRTIGNIDYVICTIPENCRIDSITKGMLLNNRIEGIAPVELTEIDGVQEYRFDVTGKHPVADIYEKHVRKQGLLTLLISMTETIIRARDYMIPEDRFLLSDDCVYVDFKNCQAELICIPAEQEDPAEAGSERIEEPEQEEPMDAGIKGTEDIRPEGPMFDEPEDIRPEETADDESEEPEDNRLEEPANNELEELEDIQLEDPLFGEQEEPEKIRREVPEVVEQGETLDAAQKEKAEDELEKAVDLITCVNDILVNCKTDMRESNSYVYFLQDYLKQENVTVDSLHDLLKRIARNEIAIPERPRNRVQINGLGVQNRNAAPVEPMPVKKEIQPPQTSPKINPLPEKDQGAIKPLSSIMDRKGKAGASGIRPLEEIMNAGRKNKESVSQDWGKAAPYPKEQTDEAEVYQETGLLVDEEEYERSQKNSRGGYLIRLSNEERIEIKGREFVIGRSEEQADYAVLGNRWISNMHASIISTDNGCYLRDLGSMNHTYLNDNMVFGKKEFKIPDGAIIRLGNERFRFKYY